MKKVNRVQKVVRWICLLVGGLAITTPVLASDDIKLCIDGSLIPTEPKCYQTSRGEEGSKYYLDVIPEIKEDRVYVPISVIATLLDIPVVLESPCITMDYKGTKLILTVGQTTATKNEETIVLDAPTYIKEGRTMVPLRFVTEAFGLGIDYKEQKVHIQTPDIYIDHTEVDVIQNQYYMTMGSVIAESDSNLCIKRIRQAFEEAKATEVAEPNDFGTKYDMDAQSYYYHQKRYQFVDGHDNVLESYEVYYEVSYGEGTGTYVLRDVMNNRWYAFSAEAYERVEELETIGDWEEVSNTVV